MQAIPVYINNRNRLTTTRNMVEYLRTVRGAIPIVFDNDSTYPPLLAWYDTNPCKVIKHGRNRGPRAPWDALGDGISQGYSRYVVTDSDLDLSGVPTDVLRVLLAGLDDYPNAVKAGLSLAIDDLPPGLKSTALIQEWERKYWEQPLSPQWFIANVDTTFAMYRADDRTYLQVSPAIRAATPYTARHVPWYRKMDSEEVYIEKHCDTKWSTWAQWDKLNEARDAVITAIQTGQDKKCKKSLE